MRELKNQNYIMKVNMCVNVSLPAHENVQQKGIGGLHREPKPKSVKQYQPIGCYTTTAARKNRKFLKNFKNVYLLVWGAYALRRSTAISNLPKELNANKFKNLVNVNLPKELNANEFGNLMAMLTKTLEIG